MGTWAAGPLENDAALDFVGSVVDGLMSHVHEFVDSPELHGNFRRAYAALAIVNLVMAQSAVVPWDHHAQEAVEPGAIRKAFLTCFDEQSQLTNWEADYVAAERRKLVETLDAFAAGLDAF